MDSTQLLTRSQVARRLGISSEYVRQLSNRGDLPCQDTPLGRLYHADVVDAYAVLRQHRKQAVER